MAVLLAPTSKNAVQKTLAAQLLSSAGNGDPISFDDVDGVPNLPGVLVINRIDSNGNATPSSREYIEYSGTSGNTVLIETRNVDGSNSALTHAVGSIVEFIPDVTWADRIYDALSNIIDTTDLSVDLTKVVTPTGTQTLSNKFITGATLSGVDISSSIFSGTINGATLSGILSGNATLPGTITLNDANFGSRKTTIYDNGNAGASLAVNLNNGETQKLTLTTTLATISLQNTEEGDYLSLYVIQASGFSGSMILAQSGGSVRYSGGASLPSLQQSNNAVNLLGIRAFNASISDVVAVSSNFV